MSIQYGKYNTLKVLKFVEFGIYLTDGTQNILLPKKFVDPQWQKGDDVRVFVYCDSEDRPVATTRIPAGCAEDFVMLEVKSATKIGAFLDWGLEKDLFVPFGEMENRKMHVGVRYLVRIMLDEKSNRIIGSNRFDRLFKESGKPTLRVGNRVRFLVYEELPLSFRGIVNRKYSGMLYKSEIFSPVAVGQELEAFVREIRRDGKLDCRMRPAGREAVRAEHDKVLAFLARNGGFYAYTPKTAPAVIERDFGLSKKLFKEVIGSLYKERSIRIENDGLRLADNAPTRD